MWDMPVDTDRTINANRPDIIVKDSVYSTCKLIDMTVPSDRNIALKETEKKKHVQRPRTRNTENVAYENCSDPCGCWCAWYSEEGYGRKHQESIRESYYDRDSKDLHAGICTNLRKVLSVRTEWLTWVTDALGAWFARGWCRKRKPAKTVIKEMIIIMTLFSISTK